MDSIWLLRVGAIDDLANASQSIGPTIPPSPSPITRPIRTTLSTGWAVSAMAAPLCGSTRPVSVDSWGHHFGNGSSSASIATKPMRRSTRLRPEHLRHMFGTTPEGAGHNPKSPQHPTTDTASTLPTIWPTSPSISTWIRTSKKRRVARYNESCKAGADKDLPQRSLPPDSCRAAPVLHRPHGVMCSTSPRAV